MQNAPLGAFCNTFDLHYAIIGLENQFSVFWEWLFLFVWFDSLPHINNLSVKQGRVNLGWTSTKQELMCLAQGPKRSDAGEAWTRGPSRVKHSTTEPLRSHTLVGILTFLTFINITSERLKAKNFFICQYYSFLWAVDISCSVEHEKFYNLRACMLHLPCVPIISICKWAKPQATENAILIIALELTGVRLR